jgi:predicted amidohydrolase YtcJ
LPQGLKGFADGSLTPGKLADLVMLDRDRYQINPADIDKARVVLTVMDGQVVWEAK